MLDAPRMSFWKQFEDARWTTWHTIRSACRLTQQLGSKTITTDSLGLVCFRWWLVALLKHLSPLKRPPSRAVSCGVHLMGPSNSCCTCEVWKFRHQSALRTWCQLLFICQGACERVEKRGMDFGWQFNDQINDGSFLWIMPNFEAYVRIECMIWGVASIPCLY